LKPVKRISDVINVVVQVYCFRPEDEHDLPVRLEMIILRSPFIQRSRCSLVGAAYLFSYLKTAMFYFTDSDFVAGEVKSVETGGVGE
jgi:hypothetical protein